MARRGFGADVIWLDGIDDGHLRPVATVTPLGQACAQDVLLAEQAAHLITHRGGFALAEGDVWQGLGMACITLVTQRDQVAWLAARVDQASAAILRDRAFRDELLHWMRLNEGGAGYDQDGLNKEALAMGAVAAWLTKPVLGTKVYDLLSGLGLGPALSGERKRTSQAGAWHCFIGL